MAKMRRGKVIFVRSNLLDLDVRLPKEMRALRKERYTITLMYWDREGKDNEPAFPKEYKEMTKVEGSPGH